MKTCACILLLLFSCFATAQKTVVNYNAVDDYARNVDASSPEDLAQKLTAPYQTELEKVRAIFSWVAQHISYNYKPGKLQGRNSKSAVAGSTVYQQDTSAVLKPLDQLVAEDVLRKRTAFCYGYARLFKCLCDHASISCEVINGYARGDVNRIGNNFRTNHTWNAVKIDSAWRLVDVTWASGYFTYNSDEFINHFDDQYFLTPPGQFALDHFPDDLEWSLLQLPPAPAEFQHSPYKSRCFAKYHITSYWPESGVIQAAIGDTINLVVKTDLASGHNIGGGSLDDSTTWSRSPTAVYCRPTGIQSNNLINYTYIVQSPGTQWLQLVYNDDMILRYKLDVRLKN